MVFHVITNFSELGGAESALIRLVNNCLHEEVTIVSLMQASEEMKKRIQHNNLEVISLNAKSSVSMATSAFKLAYLLFSINPSKVYSWMYHANAVSAVSKILSLWRGELIWGVRHSLDDLRGEKVSTKVAIYLGRFLRKIPYKVIYCSARAQEQHENFRYNNINKSIYIPNGYTFGTFSAKLFDKRPLVLGAAGRFHAAKDYGMLFRSVALLKQHNIDFRLCLCGRNIDSENLELTRLVEESGLTSNEIMLLGEISDMTSFYESIDVFLLTSKTEGFPNVLAEAAANGCAVFSTNVGDASIIINNDEHIVPIGDSASLVNSLISFFEKGDCEKRRIALITTHHVRNNFSIEKTVKLFSEL